jgi:RimJ/RimL family protein N-acetyltransferase
MRLEPYEDADFELTVALETDPEVMRELGGPRPLDALAGVHRRRAAPDGPGDRWLKIVPEPGGPAAGTIGVWPSEWRGEPAHEVGWMVLPRFQGRGLASDALRELIGLLRADGRPEEVHAFPGTANAPSNALCRSAGFDLVERGAAVSFAGRELHCNHWVLRLRDCE